MARVVSFGSAQKERRCSLLSPTATVEDLKKEGKIRFFGVSVNDYQDTSVLALIRSGHLDTAQLIYNAVHQAPEEELLLPACADHTAARYVRAREEGRLVPGASSPRPGVIGEFLPKLEELVERSKGKVRADVAHEKIAAMGFTGSERTTRRAVARLKKAWYSGRRRVFRPWVPEPRMWAQYDFGDGPRIGDAAISCGTQVCIPCSLRAPRSVSGRRRLFLWPVRRAGLR